MNEAFTLVDLVNHYVGGATGGGSNNEVQHTLAIGI